MSNKKKILWVEDDLDYQQEMKDSFGDQFELTFVTNVEEAEIELGKCENDLLIVDLYLKGEKNAGAKLVEQVKKNYPALPIIIVSAGRVSEMIDAQTKGAARTILSKSELNIERWTQIFDDFMRPTVFLSHSSVDKPFVEMLARDLEPHCAKVWFDKKDIKPGRFFLDEITKGIKASSFLIILLTKNSVESDWVKFELRKAFGRILNSGHGRLIPIMLEDCDLPDYMEDVINYSDWKELYKKAQIEAKKLKKKINKELFWRSKEERYKQTFQEFDEMYVGKLAKLLEELGLEKPT